MMIPVAPGDGLVSDVRLACSVSYCRRATRSCFCNDHRDNGLLERREQVTSAGYKALK